MYTKFLKDSGKGETNLNVKQCRFTHKAKVGKYLGAPCCKGCQEIVKNFITGFKIT